MKTNQFRLFATFVILIFISVTTILAQPQNSGKGEVIAVRFLELKAEVDTTEFEKFARDEYNPALEGTVPGLKEYIAKSDRGINVGSYALILVIDSQIVRDLMFPDKKTSDWVNKIFEDQNLLSLWDKLNTYVVDGSLSKYNDFVVLR